MARTSDTEIPDIALCQFVAYARRYSGWRYPIEDVIQEMRIAYWRASRDWKPGGGASKHNYCMARAQGRVKQFIRDTGFLIRVPAYKVEQGYFRHDPVFYDQYEEIEFDGAFYGRDFAPYLIEVMSE